MQHTQDAPTLTLNPTMVINEESKGTALPDSSESAPTEELLIGPSGVEKQYWRDLWRYRELFYFLAWRDLAVRYKQTVVGVSWSLVRPLLTMVVLTFVFGKLGKMPSGGVPYALLVFSGMLPWQFFATAMVESGNSLVSNSNLISKVYFPRLIVVVSSIANSCVELLISGVFLVMIMIWYRYTPPVTVLLLPFFVLTLFGVSFGVSLWIAALMVEYRDFRFIVPFMVQFGLYISPVGFQSAVIPAGYRLLYALNPMVGVIDGFRWCLLGTKNVYWPGFAVMAVEVVVLVSSGLWYFRKTERTFADVI